MTNPHQIRQTVTFDVKPERVYTALLESKQHAAFTEGKSEIDATEGGSFSCHDGAITGRNLELVKNERIVQAWRVGNWDEGVYSVVRYELANKGGKTEVTFAHDGFPDGQGDHLAQGWHERYWNPMKKFFSDK